MTLIKNKCIIEYMIPYKENAQLCNKYRLITWKILLSYDDNISNIYYDLKSHYITERIKYNMQLISYNKESWVIHWYD